MPTLHQMMIVAFAAAFIILFATKTGAREAVRDFCDTKKLIVIAKMLDCDFCFSFWTSLAVSIIFALVTKDTQYIFVAFLATPIARFLL